MSSTTGHAHKLQELTLLLCEIDSCDYVELNFHARKLHIYVNEDVDIFDVIKNRVKKGVLEEILKLNPRDMPKYKAILEQVKNNIQKISIPYQCCFSGCRFEARQHRDYVRHIKVVHPRVDNVKCNYRKSCLRVFTNIDNFIKHVKDDHANRANSNIQVLGRKSDNNVDVSCKCVLHSCGSRHFQNVKDLMTHLNTFHLNDTRKCIFDNCNSQFRPGYLSRYHFRKKHKDLNLMQLKRAHLVNPNDYVGGREEFIAEETYLYDGEVDNIIEDDYDSFEFDSLEVDEGELKTENEDFFLKYYADFLNRMAHFKFIPQSTVQEIAEEYYEHSKKSLKVRAQKLRKVLTDIGNISVDKIDEIIKSMMENDVFLQAQEKLNTQYKRTKYIEEHFTYTPPMEIVLNKDEVKDGAVKDVLHYVPMKDALQNLMQDKTVMKMFEIEKRQSRPTDVICDIKDGTLYKKSPFFTYDQNTYGLIFYSDGVEIKNPLGAARGTYKVVQVFFTLVDVPRNQRSNIDKLQLAMVFKEKLLKKYSYETILRRMISDLEKLEEGISLDIPLPTKVRFGVLMYIADNLEAHQLGGFSTCFSSKFICRFCHIKYDMLDENIHDFDGLEPHARWEISEYDAVFANDSHVDIWKNTMHSPSCENGTNSVNLSYESNEDCESEEDLREDSDYEEVNHDAPSNDMGLKFKCPLNCLKSFHCVSGFAPDLMHDLLGILHVISAVY